MICVVSSSELYLEQMVRGGADTSRIAGHSAVKSFVTLSQQIIEVPGRLKQQCQHVEKLLKGGSGATVIVGFFSCMASNDDDDDDDSSSLRPRAA
ncbi:hypothetical protein Aduo_016538 [Ancylostoma duodenale]